MSPRQKVALSSLVLLAGLAYWGFHSETSTRPEVVPGGIPLHLNAVVNAPINAVANTPATAPEKNVALLDQVAKPPSVSSLRKEVQKNPHITPPSLLRFGVDLGVRMKSAKQDQAAAITLLKELETCATPAQEEESPVQARALCLVTARELEQAWPDLHEEVEKLIENADPKAVELGSKISKIR